MGDHRDLPVLASIFSPLTASPSLLDFGTILSRSAVSQRKFTVSSLLHKEGKIGCSSSWVMVEPDTFSRGSTTVSVRIISDSLERGKMHNGDITLLVAEYQYAIRVQVVISQFTNDEVEAILAHFNDTERYQLARSLMDEHALTVGVFLSLFQETLDVKNEENSSEVRAVRVQNYAGIVVDDILMSRYVYIQALIEGMTPDNYYHLPRGGELL